MLPCQLRYRPLCPPQPPHRSRNCASRCLDFLVRHVAEFSLQCDPSDTGSPGAEVAAARVWLAPAPSSAQDDESRIAASYVVAYDHCFSCPVNQKSFFYAVRPDPLPPKVILFSFSHPTTGQPLSHARSLQLVNHDAASISQRICCGTSMCPTPCRRPASPTSHFAPAGSCCTPAPPPPLSPPSRARPNRPAKGTAI